MKNFKKILATVLAVLFVASVAVVSVSAASADSAWYKKAVEYLDGAGISNIGSTGGEEVSRDEFVTWVAKIESHQLIESAWKNQEWIALSTFSDVGDSEHQGAIGYSIGRKFIVGNGDGTFSPHEAIKFGEAAAIVVRLMSYESKVTGETWDEQVANYEFVANTFCGAFDNTFLSKTAQYDPNHKLTKGEAAYILYTIMNGAAWADDQITAEEAENLNLTSYGVDLGEFFATNGSATVKAQFVVANVPMTYSNTTQSFRRYDAYVTGATYDSLFADKLFQSNGLLDTSAGKVVKLQNIATGYYVTLPASVFSTLVKKAAGHGSDDTNALNYVEYGGVVTLATSKANKANLGLTANVALANANTITSFKINDSNAVDTYYGQAATTLANVNNGAQVTGWKFASAKAATASAYTRLTSTPATWTNVKYNAAGNPTSGNLVVNGQTYSVVSSYSGKANEIKVFAPAEIFNADGTLAISKAIPSVVGRFGDVVYVGGVFSDYQKQILNLHRHVLADNIGSDVTYYTRSGAGTQEDPYVYTEVDLDTFVYDEDETYYVETDAGYTAAAATDFTTTVDALKVAATTDQAYTAGKTYYVQNGQAYDPATRANFTVAFTQGTTYYVWDAVNSQYVVNAAAYDVDTVYYLQTPGTFETYTAALDDFTVAFTGGTTYYEAAAATTADLQATLYEEDANGSLVVTNDAITTTWTAGKTYYTYDAQNDEYTAVDTANDVYDANTVYYFANEGTAYTPATADDFSTYFKSGTNYYTAEAADTTAAVDVDEIGGAYYKVVGGNLVETTADDFTVGFDANTTYYTYDAQNNQYVEVDQAATAYDPDATYYVASGDPTVAPTANQGYELVIATLADLDVAWDNTVTYYEVAPVNTANTAYQVGTTYYVEDTVVATPVLRTADPTDFTVYFALAFDANTVYYEMTENGKFVATEDTEVDITKTYFVDGDYNEFFNGNTVKTQFIIEEDIPSWVTYELTTNGAFVTNTSFNIVSEFVVDGKLDQTTINTKKALSVGQALQLILGPAQGESNVIFSDTDGDGAYDVAVVTESSRALYYNEVNSATDPAGEGYLGGNASATREVYDSFGNYITTVQGLKGHNIGGLVVDKTVGVGGTSGGGTDGWNTTSTVATNKVQLVVCMSNERQLYGGNNDTALYGVSNVFPYKTVDVATLTTGYIENVASGTTEVGGVEVYTASVIKSDGERTTVYIPVEPAEKIVINVTLDGVASDVTFAAGKSLLSFVSDHVADQEIGVVQTGSWMAGHTVKYVAYENGVAWCMVDTAKAGAVVGYVTGVTKTDTGDNTYKVSVVASTSEATTSTNFAPTAQSVAAVVTYGYGSAMVVNSFGIDAIFAEEGVLTVKAYKCTQEAINQFTTLTNSNMFQGISGNAPLTGIYYEGDPDGTKKPTLVGTGYVTSSTFNKAGIIISAYDYKTYVRPAYQNATYWEEVEYDAHDLFGYIDWTAIGNKTATSTTSYIGGSVKNLEVKGAATAVWTYDTPTYNLINSILVKNVYYAPWVETDTVVSAYDLVYLSFTKDAGSLYTIDGIDMASYLKDVDTGDTDWGAIYMGNSSVFFTAGKLSSNYRTRASLAYRYPLLKTGAGYEDMWTNGFTYDFNNFNILGYTKVANSKTNIVDANNTVYGYYELYNMTIGENPYYVRTINNGKITYTLYFSVVRTLTNVRGYYYYQVDPNNTIIWPLSNKATMKQEVDDGVSYNDTSVYYVDESGLVWAIWGNPVYDQTKTTSDKPEYNTEFAVAGALVREDIAAKDIKTVFGLDKDVKEENIVSLSVAPYTEDEAGYVPGLYHVYLTNGLGSVKSFQMNQTVKIVVIYPDSETGNFKMTVTTPKDLYANKATVFVTDYQYDGSATTCTMLSVIGKLNTPVAEVIDDTNNDTVTKGTKLVYLNGDATVIAEAIQLSDYWVIRSTESAIDVTTGEEVGSIQFVFTTYKEDKITAVQEALRAGGYFLINKDNEVISSVAEAAGTYGTSSQYAQVLTGVITSVSANGTTKATIKGVENTDLSKYTTKFIYHDMDGANFGIGGSNTNVAVSTMAEIAATYAADEAIIAEGAGVAPHFYEKADIAAAKEAVATAKAGAIASYLNGTFWNVEFSPLYNYFVSQRVSYQNRGAITLTFNYVVINDVMYVFVNSFAK